MNQVTSSSSTAITAALDLAIFTASVEHLVLIIELGAHHVQHYQLLLVLLSINISMQILLCLCLAALTFGGHVFFEYAALVVPVVIFFLDTLVSLLGNRTQMLNGFAKL